MATSGRRSTVEEGQALVGLRRRDLSGFHVSPPPALHELLHDVGKPAWACGPTAAGLHRIEGFVLDPPFHLLVPRGRNISRVGHVIHTSIDIPRIDLATPAGLPAVSATRALIELARDTSPERLAVALDSAVALGLTTDDFLHRRIAVLRSSGRYGIPRLLEVMEGAELARGGASWLEREFLRLVGLARLPRPATQQVLGRRGSRLIRVDFHFEGTPIVVETMGYRYHSTPRQATVDAERMNRLQLNGFRVLVFTYRQVVDDPDGVIATLREALGSTPRRPETTSLTGFVSRHRPEVTAVL